MARLEVSIDQDECTSCNACPDIVRRHFYMHTDGLAYVKDDSITDPSEPKFFGYMGKVAVAEGLENDVIEAAEECPGECIYVEPVEG